MVRLLMIDKDRMICVCNSLDISEISQYIKDNNVETLQELLDNQDEPMGDKCELCIEEGFENDGFSLAMVLSLTKQGRL